MVKKNIEPTDPPYVRLRMMMERANHSNIEAAELIGCDPTYLASIRQGQRIPSERIRKAIQSAYGVPADSWPSEIGERA